MKTSLLLAVLCLGAFTTLHASSEKIVCFGDSLTYGRFPEFQLDETNNWVGLITASNPGITFVNAGKNGRPSDDFAALSKVLTENPDASRFIVMLGTNDLGPKTDVEKTAANLKKMITEIRAKAPKAKILLMAPPNVVPANFNDWWKSKRGVGEHTPADVQALEKAIEKLAASERVDFLSLREVLPAGSQPDGIHANPAGHAAMAQAVRQKLQLQ
jgi:lysophospholipase L1-like esterase